MLLPANVMMLKIEIAEKKKISKQMTSTDCWLSSFPFYKHLSASINRTRFTDASNVSDDAREVQMYRPLLIES